MAEKKITDCRLCKHYMFDRDLEAELFYCDKGFFNYIDYGGGDISGKFGYGCGGKKFELNKNSRWYKSEDKEGIKEKKEIDKNNFMISQNALRNYLGELGLDWSSVIKISHSDFKFLTEWKLNPSVKTELEKADSIVSFSFGFGPLRKDIPDAQDSSQFNPELHYYGESNLGLAKVILELNSQGIDLPVYAQWEVAEALRDKGIFLDEKNIAKPKGDYLNTKGVLEQFFENGLEDSKSLILVSQPYHAPRCKWIMEKAYKDRGKSVDILIADTSSVGFDRDSLQPWTRSLEDWVKYEVGSRFANRHRGDI